MKCRVVSEVVKKMNRIEKHAKHFYYSDAHYVV